MNKDSVINELDLTPIIGEIWVPCSWLSNDYDYITRKIVICVDSCTRKEHIEAVRKMIFFFEKFHEIPLLTERLLMHLNKKYESIYVE